jgi:sugar lactone lactonase YvrE
MNKVFIAGALLLAFATSCQSTTKEKTSEKSTPTEQTAAPKFPKSVKVENIAQNPEGIEYNKNDKTFFLSSLNATPIIKVNLDGTHEAFTSGEAYPMSSAGLQIDYERNRLLATGFNGLELMDGDPATKGISNLRIYNLETGMIEKDINLSSLAPDASAYFANDIAVDSDGNAYVSDWYAGLVYKVDIDGNASVFWTNQTGIPSGPNGLDFHPDGYLLVSILVVNEQGLYADYGLVKIPTNDPKSAQVVSISNDGFTGFDGMVLTSEGTVIGVTNDGKMPGGNTLIELSSENGWESATVINTKAIKASTTVAITPEKHNYVINQDFQNSNATSWTIERIEF